MARVTGIGGVFFRCKDPAALQAWYVEHLGLPLDDEGYVVISWGGDHAGTTVWGPFPEDTTRFAPDKGWQVNYRVDDLDALLTRLRSAGVRVDEGVVDDGVNGRFAWAWDPEGNRIELWEPNPGL